MNKEQLIREHEDIATAMRGYLGTTLTIPEIQAQVKRTLLSMSDLDDRSKQVYQRFLQVTNAPEGIEKRYTGEHCTRIYISRGNLDALLRNRPAYLRGGIAFLRKETESTCIVWKSAIDNDISNWLRAQGIKLEHVWESEIGKVS